MNQRPDRHVTSGKHLIRRFIAFAVFVIAAVSGSIYVATRLNNPTQITFAPPSPDSTWNGVGDVFTDNQGIALALLLFLTIGLLLILSLRSIRTRRATERELKRLVAERTRDFEDLMRSTVETISQSERAKRAALSEANALLHQFISHAPAAIAMLDADLVYVAHTDRWKSDHHANHLDLIGRRQPDVLPHLWFGWEEAYLRCVHGEVIEARETLVKTPEGAEQWLSWAMRPWYADDGSLKGLIMMTEDITARKAIRQELKTALERAESAARAKSDFLANMSHELRTPLSGILGAADVLLADTVMPLSADHRRLIEVQRTCGADLLDIVNDILDFSKAEAGNLTLETISLDIGALAQQAAKTIQPSATKKQIALDVHIDSNVPKAILGDPTRLRQILLNLLSNAVKFTPENGKVRLEVSTHGTERLRIVVTDTGIGIPEATIPLLFTRFTQADTSTTRLHGGTGLGLAICRQLTDLMGGKISVVSRLGEGATFTLELPVRAAATTTPAPTKPKAQPPRRLTAEVLVAEDNATNRMLVARILGSFGCTVTLVTNGLEAVEAVVNGTTPFDVVLMDIQMPQMDGIVATKRIRAFEASHPERGHVPIVALTANSFAEEVNDCREAGMDDHLLKPIDLPKLYAMLAALTQSQAIAPAA